MFNKLKLIVIIAIMNITTVVSQEEERALQSALNLKQLQEVITDQSNANETTPIIMVVGDRIPRDLDVHIFNEKIKIIEDENELSLTKKGHPYLELGKAKIKNDKAEYIFFYKKMKMVVELKKQSGNWKLKDFTKKKRKNFSWLFDF